MNKKSVVEDTLFQIKNLEQVLKENAKGILSSTMKDEISSLVKESLREQEEIDVEAKVTKVYEHYTMDWRITSITESKIDEVIS